MTVGAAPKTHPEMRENILSVFPSSQSTPQTDGFPLQAVPALRGKTKFNICTFCGVRVTDLSYHKV